MSRVPMNNYVSQSLARKQMENPTIIVVKKKWHFKPRSIWPFLMWGLTLFIGFKITVLPLIEGIYNYVTNVSEMNQLKVQYNTMQKQLDDMKKKRDYMKTSSYVEERAHEIGLVKPEESQMVVIEGVPSGVSITKSNKKKKIEIGD